MRVALRRIGLLQTALAALLCGACAATREPAALPPAPSAQARPSAERADALLAQMTLDEKISQMMNDAPAIERLGIPAYNWWSEALHGVARAGLATVFPQAIGLAA